MKRQRLGWVMASLLSAGVVAGCDGGDGGGEAGTGDETGGDDDGADDGADGAGEDDGSDDGNLEPPRVSTMKVHLPQATALALELDPNAELVRIEGVGLRQDGTIDLDAGQGFARRWTYDFIAANGPIRVGYYSEDVDDAYPEVIYPAEGVMAAVPIVAPDELPDSDVVAAAFAEDPVCGTLGGGESVSLLYLKAPEGDGNGVQILTSMVSWAALIEDGLQVVDTCG